MNISVVIPAYNEQQYIAQCLSSLAAQTTAPYEVIVVDNNSTDKTAEIVSRQFPNVRLIQEPNQGMAYARNAGYNAARGTIIARCDADCRPPANWIAQLEGLFTNPQTHAVTGPSEFYDYPLTVAPGMVRCMDIVKKSIGYALTYGPNHALRKTAWNDIATSTCTHDARIHEDGDLGYHLHAAGYEIHIVPQLMMMASARRLIRHPFEVALDYPRRLEYTLKSHDPRSKFRFFELYKALLPQSA